MRQFILGHSSFLPHSLLHALLGYNSKLHTLAVGRTLSCGRRDVHLVLTRDPLACFFCNKRMLLQATSHSQRVRCTPGIGGRQNQTTKLRERAGLRPGIPERATASIFQLVTMFAAIRRASSRVIPSVRSRFSSTGGYDDRNVQLKALVFFGHLPLPPPEVPRRSQLMRDLHPGVRHTAASDRTHGRRSLQRSGSEIILPYAAFDGRDRSDTTERATPRSNRQSCVRSPRRHIQFPDN
jgi:hypothetical protein